MLIYLFFENNISLFSGSSEEIESVVFQYSFLGYLIIQSAASLQFLMQK